MWGWEKKGKGPFLETRTFTGSGQSQHLPLTFCSCNWPNNFNPSYAAHTFIPLYHFSINFNQLSHPEETGSTFLWNISAFSNYIMQKPKRSLSLESNKKMNQMELWRFGESDRRSKGTHLMITEWMSLKLWHLQAYTLIYRVCALFWATM